MDLTDPADLVAHRTGDSFESAWEIPHYYPKELGECLIRDQLFDIHNQVNTPREARDYLIKEVIAILEKCNTRS